MNTNPLISIVIANFNYGRFIGDAIRSVLSQHLDEVELIVVDGASKDDSIEVVKSLAGREIACRRTQDEKGDHAWHECEHLTWLSEKDHGQSDAFNKGFGYAHGKFLTWLNADDVFAKDSLSAVIRVMRRYSKCRWFVGSSIWCDSALKIVRVFRAHRFSLLRAKWGFLCAEGPSSFFSKEMWKAVGGIDENLHYVMDIDLWMKFYRLAGASYRRTTHDVWVFRMHADSKMSGADVSKSEKALVSRQKANNESSLVSVRYNKPRNWRFKVANMLSFSIVDKIIALSRERRLKGASMRWFDEEVAAS